MAPTRLVVFGLLLLTFLPSPVPAQRDINDESYFLLTNFVSVKVLNLRGEVQHEIRNTNSHQVDFDPMTARLFWPDFEQRSINAAFLNGSQRTALRQLPSGSTPVGVAVDHILHLVFYSDNSRHVIGVMDTGGGSHRIVRNQGLSYPWALAVDVIHEYVYYTEDREPGNLGRVAYSGGSHQVLHSALAIPRGLALDVRGGRMYWSTFRGDGRIESARLDGTDRNLVLQGVTDQLGLALFDGVLYYTRRYISSIYSVTVTGTNRPEMTITVTPETCYDITVYSKSRAITFEEKEAALRPSETPSTATPRTTVTTTQTPRTVVTTTPTRRTVVTTTPTPRTVVTTTPTPRTVVTTTATPRTVETTTPTPRTVDTRDDIFFLLTNMNNLTILNMRGEIQHELTDTYSHQVDFDPTAGRIFWPDRYRQTINTALLNGSQRTVLRQLPTGSDPVGVAVDHTQQLIFYSAYNAQLIGVMDTGGASHRVVRDQGLTRPWALAVDVIHEFLYYTEGQGPGNIGRMDYRGSQHEVLLSCERMPVGLALDVRGGRMYWSTLLDGRILSARLDGTDRTIVQQELFYQYGLAFLDGVLYFTNNGISSILSVTVNGTNRKELEVGVITTYFDITVYNKSQAITLEEKLAAREALSKGTLGSK